MFSASRSELLRVERYLVYIHGVAGKLEKEKRARIDAVLLGSCLCVAFSFGLPGKREMGGGPNGFHGMSGDKEVRLRRAGKIK